MNGNQLMLTREKRKSKVANITGQYCLNKTTSTTITSPPMPSKKTKKSRPGLDGAAIAYKEDLGMQGIKTSVGNKDKNKFLTILERPLANDEEQRRLQRVVRTNISISISSVVYDLMSASSFVLASPGIILTRLFLLKTTYYL
jgi:hypothetical protein